MTSDTAITRYTRKVIIPSLRPGDQAGRGSAAKSARMGEDHWNYWWYFGLALIARR
jgi:hypothetical protein